jgi:dipeptidyl aminopeptidase/acylaminoacyl peptidase
MILWRVIVYSALICAVSSFILFYLYAHPKHYISPFTPSASGFVFEAVKLTTADGVELAAWYIPNKKSKNSLIICHGYPMDKGNVLGMTSFLARGFNLLLFDFRAMGGSGGFFSTGGAKELKDVDAAITFLKERGFHKIGVFGFSMGAAAALMSANPAIAARAADSPFAEVGGELDYALQGLGFFRHPLLLMMKAWSVLLLGVNMNKESPVNRISALRTPVLIIHGDKDSQVPVDSSFKLKAACPGAELWIIKDADHGEAAALAGPAYETRVAGFFEKALKD